MGLLQNITPEGNQNLLNLGMALMSQGGYTTMPTTTGQAFGNAVAQMQQYQRMRNQDLLNQQKTQAEIGRTDMENKLSQTQLDNIKRQQAQQDALARGSMNLIGQEPNMTNNFQGTGLLGGQVKNSGFNNQLASLMIQNGQVNDGLALLKQAQSPLGGMDLKNAPAIVQTAIALGKIPGTTEFNQFVAGNSQQALNNQRQQNEMQRISSQSMAKADTKKLEAADDTLKTAVTILPSMQHITDLANQTSNWAFGRFAGRVSDLFSTNAQEIEAAAKQLALDMKGMTSSGMPGSLSDSDRKFLETIAGGLTSNKQATLDNLRYIADKAKNQIARAQFYRKTYKENGSLPYDIDSQFDKIYQNTLAPKIRDYSSLMGQ
jgi:hypothetical protein